MTTRRNCARESPQICLIIRELRKIAPDIVYGQGTEGEYAFTAVTSPNPNVITIHGIMHRVHRVTPPLSLNHVPRWIEKLVVRKAKDVICLSGETEDFLKERGSPARRHRIPNAIAPCFFRRVGATAHAERILATVRRQHPSTKGPGLSVFFDAWARPRTPNGFSLLFVGSIHRLKGLVYLVEALATARQKLGAPIMLRLAGKTGGGADGIRYDKLLRRRADELGVATNIEWLGALGERDVAAALT